MNFRDMIPDYDIKIRKAEMIARENAGEMLNIHDFLPPAENEHEAELIIKALKARNEGYIFITTDEEKWNYPFFIKITKAMAEGRK
ncbi:MAG: hypothetical protein ACP5RE_04195 [Candidatus Acidifodinimicrobium sp.]